MFKYLQALTITLLLLGCAQSATGTSKKQTLSAGKAAEKIPVSKNIGKDSQQAKKVLNKPESEVSKIINRYKTETPIQVKIRKHVQSPYLMKEKISNGELKIGKSIFRLDLEKPDDSTMVLDGRYVWLETRLDPSMGGKVQVSKFALNNTRRANAIFAILFGEQSLEEGFILESSSHDSAKNKTYTYKPKKEAVDYKKVIVTLSSKTQQLVSFAYEDELENKVIYNFGKTKFKAKLRQWQLEYTPPKGVKPSEF